MAVKLVLTAVLGTCALAVIANAPRAPSAARLAGFDEVSAVRAAKPDPLATAERVSKVVQDIARQPSIRPSGAD